MGGFPGAELSGHTMAEESDNGALYGGGKMHGGGIDADIVAGALENPRKLLPRGGPGRRDDPVVKSLAECACLGDLTG